MYAQQAQSALLQPSRNGAIATLVNWLKQRLEARRKARAELRHIAFLRSFERRALEDMGVDVSCLPEIRPTLASFSPPAVISAFLNGQHQSR